MVRSEPNKNSLIKLMSSCHSSISALDSFLRFLALPCQTEYKKPGRSFLCAYTHIMGWSIFSLLDYSPAKDGRGH